MWILKGTERWSEVSRKEVEHGVGGIQVEEEAGFAGLHQSAGQP